MRKFGAVAPLAIVLILVSNRFCLAWGPGTHLYIASQVLKPLPEGELALQAYYGSMLPDLKASMADAKASASLGRLTHTSGYHLVKDHTEGDPALEAFAAGWITHNGVWGADYYAHAVNPIPPPEKPGYAILKGRELEAICAKIPKGMGEDFVEAAIDLLVKRNLDPELGAKMKQAAESRNPQIVQLLIKAYSPPIEAKALTDAEALFRNGVAVYALPISAATPTDESLAAWGLSLGTGMRSGQNISVGDCVTYLRRAIELCQGDYRQALDATIANMRAHMTNYQVQAAP